MANAKICVSRHKEKNQTRRPPDFGGGSFDCESPILFDQVGRANDAGQKAIDFFLSTIDGKNMRDFLACWSSI